MNKPLSLPQAWLCEFIREDDTTDTRVVLDDPECTRWADCADGDGVSPYRVTPLYTRPALPEDWLDRAMELVADIAREKWSEGVSCGSYMDKAGERRSASEAEELTAALRAHLALAVKEKEE